MRNDLYEIVRTHLIDPNGRDPDDPGGIGEYPKCPSPDTGRNSPDEGAR